MLEYIPDQYKTQEMCEDCSLCMTPWMLEYVPDQYKSQKMCNSAVEAEQEVLEYVPD